jgi:hypothetical protein
MFLWKAKQHTKGDIINESPKPKVDNIRTSTKRAKVVKKV